VWKLDLSAQAVAVLEARTEGWAVGLQLAALSLRERRDPDAFLEAFTGSHRYVLDYLSEEVLKGQPERLRTFLLQTSILERLSGPLCDAVTGGTDGQDTLEVLERANLFLVPLDEQRRWYRLHHLFADLLRAQLQQVQAGQVPDLHRRAAAWCEQHGLVDDAIRHALASGDSRWATRLVERNLNDTLRRGEGMILERWLSALPGDAVRGSPSLCFAQTLMQLRLGHLDTFERLLEHGECAIDQGQWPADLEVATAGGMVAAVRAAIALLRAEVAVSQGDAEAAAEHARSALAQMAETEHGPRRWARWLLACADWMGGRLADAESAYAEVLAEGRAAARRDSPSPRASPVEAASTPLIAGCFTLGRVQRTRADLGAALRTYEEGLRFASESGHVSAYHAAEAHVGLAQVLYERDELNDALEHVTAGIDLSRQMVELTVPIFGLVTLAWIRQARGDPDGALAAMADACRMRPSIEVSPHNPAPAEWARLALAQGRLDDAAHWAHDRGLAKDENLSFPREPDYLVWARVLVAQGFPDRALRLLERLDRLAESQGRKESLIRIRTVRALATHAAGDQPGALTVLAEALALGRPAGYVRVFADEGPPLAALLRSLVSARPRAPVGTLSPQLRQQVSRVRQACETVTSAAERPAAAGLVDPLTGRELEVLRLIADGRHNREIARDLYVTLDTVKKHTSHILTKLGVTSRTHAVARARQLDLL
jgi:LuxR family maltose regulon positive regulatory protein